ncbi:MAG TPA: hypothetical protein VH540_19815 [Ktedonobacterales bacterium]|jgi:hypothetical protein
MKSNRRVLALISCLIAFMLLVLSGCGSANTATTAPTTRPTPSVNTGLPDDIPLYPGAQLVGTTAPGQASFQMPGSPQAISSYYQAQMPEHGWKTDQVQDNGADGILLAFSKPGRIAHFAIAPGTSAQQTTVLITVSTS